MISSRTFLLGLGLLALLASAYSAYDATRPRPTDGAQWLLGGKEIRVVGLTPGGPADRAGLQIDDVVEGIDNSAIRSPRHAAELLQRHEVGDQVDYLIRRGRGVRRVYEARLTLDSTRLADVTTYVVYCALGLFFLIVGTYVFLSNPHQAPARIFYIFCLAFLLYFCSGSERSTIYYWSDVFIRNVGSFASLLVPPLFLHFFLVFPRRRTFIERRPWIVPLLYLVPSLYYLDFTWSQFYGARAASIGPFQQMTLGFFFSAGLASLVWTYLSSADPTLRQRVKLLTLGTVLGTLPYLIFNIALGKLLGQHQFALIGAVPMLLVPVSFGYSIARYRLMEIEVIIRRSIIYAVLTGLTVGAYFVLVVVVGSSVLNLAGQRSQLIAIIATLIIAAAFAPARERIQAFIERSFFREKHDLQQALRELARDIPLSFERTALRELLQERITRLLHPTRFCFLETRGERVLLECHQGELELIELGSLLRRRTTVLTAEVLQAEELRALRRPETPGAEQLARELQRLREERIEVIVPAFAGHRLAGGFALGPKKSEAAYEGAEIETLQIVGGQLGLQLENARLVDEAVARQRLEEELAMARNIQQRMLPRELPKLTGYELAAVNISSAQVSGDYYDFVALADGTYGVVISDVSGKGLAASLLASNLQASIRALGGTHTSPGAILTAVNRSLHESTDDDRFATTFLASLRPDGLVYSNGGHNPPLVRRACGSIEWLQVGATPLGAFPGIEYPEAIIALDPGDLVVLFTDGVTEAPDADDEFFGESGLLKIVEECADWELEDMLTRLREAVFLHCQGKASDDMTIVLLRRNRETPALEAA